MRIIEVLQILFFVVVDRSIKMATKVLPPPYSRVPPSSDIWRSNAPPPSKCFQSNNHSSQMLEQFSTLRTERVLCDGTIIASGEHFSVHRIILASCSEYFRDIFKRNDNLRDIQLGNAISKLGVELLLQYAYTSKITLTLENVHTVLLAAVHLRMSQVTELCIDYLTSTLNVQNCVQLLQLAERNNFDKLKKSVQDFIVDEFLQVSETSGFQELNADQVTFFISQDRMAAGSEMQLFMVAAKWLEYDRATREQYAPQLMRHIRFPLISSNELVDHVQSHDFMMNNPECHQLLLEALNYHLVPHRQHNLQNSRTRMRSVNEVVLTTGGELPRQEVSNQIMIFDESHHRWKKLTTMPLRRVDHSIAVLNHFLYIAGGQVTLNSNGKESIGTVHRYDPRFNTWLQMCPMQQRRAFFHLAALGDSLYAIGGKNEQGALSSAEVYSTTENKWKYLKGLPEKKYALAGCCIKNKLFVCGGFSNHKFSRNLYLYGQEGDDWIPRCPMNTARGFHMMCSVRDMIYVMGGNHLNTYGDRVDVMSVEKYDPLHDHWITVSPMLTGLSMAGSSVTENNKIFIVGGYNGLSRQREKDIHRYNVAEDEWDVVGELPKASLRMACCTLTLPYNLFQELSPREGQPAASGGINLNRSASSTSAGSTFVIRRPRTPTMR